MSSALGYGNVANGLLTNFSRVLVASQSKVSILLVLLLLSLSAWISGQLLWSVLEQQDNVAPWSPKATVSGRSPSSDGLDVSKLVESVLFGEYKKESANKPVVQEVRDAPKTRLNLILVGAVSSSTPEAGLAVISNRGTQATYGIGEQIEGTKAKLKAVYIDRVIIDNSGRDETLMLEGIEFSRPSQDEKKSSSNASARGVGNNPAPDMEQLEKIRQEVLEDPQKIMQYIRLSQVKRDGQLLGYRVRPGKQRVFFDSVGLKNGDVAIALNGEDLTDPKSMGKIWKSISEVTEFNLTVERGGQTHEIYIAF